jgi:hypothetical protein
MMKRTYKDREEGGKVSIEWQVVEAVVAANKENTTPEQALVTLKVGVGGRARRGSQKWEWVAETREISK